MKRFLIPLLAALVLPTAVEANWFGKYRSEREAMDACVEWRRKGGKIEDYWDYKRVCYAEYSTNQILGIDENEKVKKRYKF